MNEILNLIEINNTELVLAMAVLIVILIVLMIINQFRNSKNLKYYRELVRGNNGINMEELLIGINKDVERLNKKNDFLEDRIIELESKIKFTIQKIGFVRYNAFDDMGSELSFSLALLDEFKNGFIYTSIYGRENTISYGKPIIDGNSKIPLSAEELIAIDRAVKGESIL